MYGLFSYVRWTIATLKGNVGKYSLTWSIWVSYESYAFDLDSKTCQWYTCINSIWYDPISWEPLSKSTLRVRCVKCFEFWGCVSCHTGTVEKLQTTGHSDSMAFTLWKPDTRNVSETYWENVCPLAATGINKQMYMRQTYVWHVRVHLYTTFKYLQCFFIKHLCCQTETRKGTGSIPSCWNTSQSQAYSTLNSAS